MKSVIFVPQTHNSELAKKMREGEDLLEKTTGYKMKIVERAGDSLEGLLHKSNPWSGADCAREKCLLYETKQTNPRIENQSCTKRNIVYETWCETCRKQAEDKQEDGSRNEIKKYLYIGESARSCYERGLEHVNDCEQLKPGSHMLKHVLDKHDGQQPGEIEFRMRVLKYHKSAYERQVHEAVMIQASSKGHNILNSRSEYNVPYPDLEQNLERRKPRRKCWK